MGHVVEVGKRRVPKSRQDEAKSRQGEVRPLSQFAPIDPGGEKPVLRPRIGWLRLSFGICVLVPTAFWSVYLAFVAPREYVSESQFVVRTPDDENPYLSIKPVTVSPMQPSTSQSATAAMSAMTAASASAASKAATRPTANPSTGGGFLAGRTSVAQQEAYMLADYVRGRSVIEDLGGKPLLYRMYARPDVDWLSRFERPASLEDAWKYWNSKVSVYIDTQSNILTLSVRAFSAQDAYNLNKMIIEKCEKLVNDVSEQSRRDALTRAETEIKARRNRLAEARKALLEFRNSTTVVDPLLSATSINETIQQLIKDKIALETNRDSMVGVVSADSPTRRLLDAQIKAKSKQIADLKQKLTSTTTNDTLSGQLAKYESLELENQFAQNLYSTALAAYQQARFELDRKQMYVALVVNPNAPDVSAYPRILKGTAVGFVLLTILWSMIALLVAAIREHVDYE